jgi:mono/diheme cytochrome c family protein
MRALCSLVLTLALLLGTSVEAQELSHGRVFAERGGEALYAGVCAACHQPDAKGAIGAGAYPALEGDRNLASADYVAFVVLNGLRGMPPVGRMMSDEQVADVVNYVRARFGAGDDDAISAATVAAARLAN